MSLKILRIVGARPQFIQAKPLSEEFKKLGHQETLFHTGQHYDDLMSQVFFQELNLPEADINLGVGAGTHGEQTAQMLRGIEAHLLENRYDAVVVDGDTNSTLAGALAASKLQIPVVHVEAGMRSYDKTMPEEINRVLTDHVSQLLFCPSQVSQSNLSQEGINQGVHISGDLLAQSFFTFQKQALNKIDTLLEEYNLIANNYVLLTLHRAENADNLDRIENYLKQIATSPWEVVWPIHPRTKKNLVKFDLYDLIDKPPFKIIPPVGYLDMLALESASIKILTDSGGVQREAYHLRKPSVILRNQTEWTEIVESGWSVLYLPYQDKSILWHLPDQSVLSHENYYGDTQVADQIVNLMEKNLL